MSYIPPNFTSEIPNLFSGLMLEYVNADTITVHSGNLEINATNYILTSNTQITLSGNLRSGETETANTFYYLYAIGGVETYPTFKFSATAPTINRNGISVSSFANIDPTEAWFHPTEGFTWRYIGQVYNNSSSDIITFYKSSPWYWESAWTALGSLGGTQSIPHSFGKIPSKIDLLCSTTSDGALVYVPPRLYNNVVYDGSSTGIEIRGNISNISIPLTIGTANIFYTTSWRTTGYIKVIIKG